MKSQPTLVRVLTPPPVGPYNLLQGPTAQDICTKALAVHLAKSAPFSPQRVSPFKLHLITVHSSQPLVAYLVVPEGSEKKKFPKTIVIQHLQTKEVVHSLTLGDLASILFNYDVVSQGETVISNQHKILQELGHVQRLDFFDPSTLYWTGHGAMAVPQDTVQRWSYLLVQLQSRIVIVNLRQNSVVVAKGISADPSRVFSPVIADIKHELLGDLMTSNAVPVSPDSIVVGTADGSLKLFNWKSNVVVQSVRPSSTKDPLVQIISANKYETPELYAERTRRRLVCLTKKGTALLIEVLVLEGIVYDVGLALAKFEGGSVPSSMSKQDDEYISMEHIILQYCAYRDLLLWNYTAKNVKGKLLVWALSDIPAGDAKNRNAEPLRYEPTLVMQFPYETTHTIFPGWFNDSMPMESMTCAAVTRDGDFHILVAPLYNSGSTTKNPFAAYPILRANLYLLLLRDLGLPEEREIYVKVHTVFCPPLRDSSIFYFGTNLGILVVKMVDGNLVQGLGSRHVYLSANFGALGKAVLTVKGPEILYGDLEPPGGPLTVDPVGSMEMKNMISLYESPPPLHLPPEIHKRPVRLPPLLLMSPSRNYLCCFWKEELRYEILHLTSLLETITSRRLPAVKSPIVASGNGVSSFAWVGDNDVFSVLYNPEQDLALKNGLDLSAPSGKITDVAKLKEIKKFTTTKKLGKLSKLQSLKGLQEIGKGTAKGITVIGKGVTKGTLKMTSKVGKVTLATTKRTTQLAVGTVGTVGGGATKVAKMGFKAAKFGFGMKKRTKETDASLATADDGDDESITTQQTPIGIIDQQEIALHDAETDLERKFPWVELRRLANSPGADGDGSKTVPTGLGELSLRSGNRNPPTVLFGGPVLCVASKTDENDEGLAYFYTKKKGSTEEDAAEYVSSGPAFPCPDLVVWDEEGRLCAVVVQAAITIYLSEEPEFMMLGTAQVETASAMDTQVISAIFLHGALFVTTRGAVHVIFLGDLEGGVCHIDLYTLACSDVFTLPSKSVISDYQSLSPPKIPMALNYPTALGYQNGSLMVSTVSGIQAIPLANPLVRIGALLGAGHQPKAIKWIEAVPESDHEALATFLERRGAPEVAITLQGISLEHCVDICMRHGFVDRLEELVEQYGLKGIGAIDMSRGLSANIFMQPGTSFVVCVAAYLLSHGRVELVRRLATECLRSGDDGKREAFMLASLLMMLDADDAMRLIHRAVQDENTESDWIVGGFVNENIIRSR